MSMKTVRIHVKRSLWNTVLSNNPQNVRAYIFGGFRFPAKIIGFPESFVLKIYGSFYQMQKDRPKDARIKSGKYQNL